MYHYRADTAPGPFPGEFYVLQGCALLPGGRPAAEPSAAGGDNIHWIMEKGREFQKNIYFCFIDYAKAFVIIQFQNTKLLLHRVLMKRPTQLPRHSHGDLTSLAPHEGLPV